MLSDVQKERLKALHAYEWADEDRFASRRNLLNLLDAIQSPEELWYASFIIQWSPENGDLDYLLDHRLCDRGIALFLYWSLDPMNLYRDGDLPIESGQARSCASAARDIEQRFARGMYAAEYVAFAPSELRPMTDCSASRRIPDELKRPTRGRRYPLDYREAVFG